MSERSRVASRLFTLALAAVALAPVAPATAQITAPVTKSICASGCDFASLVPEARDWLAGETITGRGRVTLQLRDGVHEAPDAFHVDDPHGRRVSILGNCENPNATVVNFATASNRHGFSATHGGAIGLVDCLVINGIGARGATEHSWNDQRYGGGIYAHGSGSWIKLGPKLTVRDFYYSLFADEGASIEAYGVRMENAGDCNLLARFASHIRCLGCHATNAGHAHIDPFGTNTRLGYNYMAEAGASMRIDGSTGERGLVAAVAAINNGAAWAHRFTGRNSRSGALVFEKGSIELDGAKLERNQVGARADTGGWLSLKHAEVTDSEGDGVLVIAASAGLDAAKITGSGRGPSGGYGVHVRHGGHVRGRGVVFERNASGDTQVEHLDEGCATPTENCRARSFLLLR